MTKYFLGFIFSLIFVQPLHGEVSKNIVRVSNDLMRVEGYEVYKVYESKSVAGFGDTEKTAVWGSYREVPKRSKLSYGYFLLLLSEKGSGSFEKEDLVIHPGDYSFIPYFLDINGDKLPDLLLHKGEEDYFSTTIYVTFFDGSHFRFRKIYNNEETYLYPFDIEGDGIPEFIEPIGEWLETESLWHNQSFIEGLSSSLKRRMVDDFFNLAKTFIKYHENKDRVPELSIASANGYYLSKIRAISFKQNLLKDVSNSLCATAEVRIDLLDEVLNFKNLSKDLRKEILKNKKYLRNCQKQKRRSLQNDLVKAVKIELQRLNYKEEEYKLTIDKGKKRWKGIEDHFLRYNPEYKNILSEKHFVVVCFDKILKPGEIIMGGSGFILIDEDTNKVIVSVPMK